MLCVRVCGAGNDIRASGATALADALKVNTGLKELYLTRTCRGDAPLSPSLIIGPDANTNPCTHPIGLA